PTQIEFQRCGWDKPSPLWGGWGGGFRRLLLVQRLQFVDQSLDHRQPLRPEGWVGGVEAEGLQEFGMVLAAAGPEEVEILLLEARRGLLVDRIERVHQAIAEGVGIDVEG